MAVLEELREAVVDGQAKLAVTKVTQGLEQGIPAEVLLQDGLIAAMSEVGQLFEEHEIYVPEMLVAARAMNATVAVLKPRLVEHEVRSSGTVAIGTVKGDLHDIGKNLVAMMLEGSGFEMVDLGIDVPPERFIDAIRAGADVVAMSALLTTTMTNMKEVVEAISAAGLRDRVRDHRRRRADHGQVRGRDRRRRLRARCLEGGAQGARAADCVVPAEGGQMERYDRLRISRSRRSRVRPVSASAARRRPGDRRRDRLPGAEFHPAADGDQRGDHARGPRRVPADGRRGTARGLPRSRFRDWCSNSSCCPN